MFIAQLDRSEAWSRWAYKWAYRTAPQSVVTAWRGTICRPLDVSARVAWTSLVLIGPVLSTLAYVWLAIDRETTSWQPLLIVGYNSAWILLDTLANHRLRFVRFMATLTACGQFHRNVFMIVESFTGQAVYGSLAATSATFFFSYAYNRYFTYSDSVCMTGRGEKQLGAEYLGVFTGEMLLHLMVCWVLAWFMTADWVWLVAGFFMVPLVYLAQNLIFRRVWVWRRSSS